MFLLMELEKEVEDVNGNEMCTDRTLWDILCEMCTDRTLWKSCVKCALIGHCGTSCVKCLHHMKYCSVIVGFLLVTLGK